MVCCAACNISPPNPNTALPPNINPQILKNPAVVNIPCPNVHKQAANINTNRGPFESINIPPNNGTIALGIEYAEYNKLNYG
jgi:hypothetical protein